MKFEDLCKFMPEAFVDYNILFFGYQQPEVGTDI